MTDIFGSRNAPGSDEGGREGREVRQGSGDLKGSRFRNLMFFDDFLKVLLFCIAILEQILFFT